MPVVPASHTFTATVATTSEANSFIRDPINFSLNPPICQLRQTVVQSLTNNTWVSLNFDAEDEDSAAGHSTSSNTSRYTAQYAGWYLCGGVASISFNATGVRGARFAINGTAHNASRALIPAIGATFGDGVAAPGTLLFLNSNDYVELQGFQNSGGSLNTEVAVAAQSAMSVVWVSN